jgi:Xaa-Pro aminopeptidase
MNEKLTAKQNERIGRVLEQMKKKGLNQLFITDSKSIAFLTGFYVEPMERLWALLLKENGEHVFFMNTLFFVSDTGYKEVWFTDMDDQIGLIAENIDTEGTLGVDKSMTVRYLVPLQERCPNLKTVWGSDCVDNVRAAKDEEEVALMKKASEINDIVMERVAGYIKEGMTEKQIADWIDAEYLKEGASGNSFPTIVCFGENAADQHHDPSETRQLKAGECILIDMGCVWQGYCSDMTRTFYCKSVDDEQAKIHDIVRTAVLKAEAAIKPGVPICDIDAQARDYVDEQGYTKYWGVRLGHFIGQDDHEYGDVSPINKNPAVPGNIFSIEPGIYIPGKYGVRVEDLVLVTEDGCELLNHVEKKYQIVG